MIFSPSLVQDAWRIRKIAATVITAAACTFFGFACEPRTESTIETPIY